MYDILPEEPLLVVPLLKLISPLIPNVPASILLITIIPDVTTVAVPVCNDIAPPVLGTDKPDIILIDPPGRTPPAAPSELDIVILPATPTTAFPVLIAIFPESPLLVVPDLKYRVPLSPRVPASTL